MGQASASGGLKPAYGRGNREMKCRPLAWLGFHPDASPGSLHDSAADRQADPSPRNVLAMQPLEHPKYPLVKLRLDPDSIVGYRQAPGAILA